MRILQVAPPWFEVPPRGYGGIELVISGLVDGLVSAGHDVVLLAAGGSVTAAELHVVHPAPPSTELGDTTTELAHVLAVEDLGPFDIVHDHTLLGTALGVARGTPNLVHTLHGPWTPRSRQVLGRLADRAALVSISRAQASAAPEVPVAAVVHNGIDVTRYPVGTERGDELLFVGRASPAKGPEQAIEVARRTGRPLHLAIKVNEADEREYWHQVLEPRLRGVDVHVVFDATLAQKTAMMARAHAVVMPIAWPEPFGLVMVEAGACGAPVVVFGRGAAPEIVRDGVTGFVIHPGAGLDAFCQAVERAGGIDPHDCRRHVVERFSAARMVDGYLGVYDALVPPRVIHLSGA